MKKKNMFRIGAVLMVCVMMLSSFSFAATNDMSYGCSVGITSSSAYTVHGGYNCHVTLDITYELADNQYGGYESDSASDSGFSSASTSCSYNPVVWADAYATHSSDRGDYGSSSESYIP